MNSFDKDSEHWKFGLFYYNKEDKRIFPPKRFGWGWTVNFANPLSVSVFLLILIAIGIITWLLPKQNS
ncbi:DUF5808 domain-containing protein [Chryseobacterium sp. MYb264]|uniref:DUF5808 domain-containing protein n=1 Tax=Chryseobacterium sp. MYb264 TaxID=2745153 RepID=UPI002E1549A6|nr:DUF5808 domain-containing protein [Chryseobacterium sp. MYb264]